MGIVERIGSELAYFRGAMRGLKTVSAIARDKRYVFPDLLDALAQRHPGRVALIGAQGTFTYGKLNARANQYAHWARSIGLGKEHTVSLAMPNCPEYLAIWFGLARAGVPVALLNTSLNGHLLAHCMNIVPCAHTIFSADLLDNFLSAVPHLQSRPLLWVAGKAEAGSPLFEAVAQMPAGDLPPGHKPDLTHEDVALYIFTSGTTGLPKAAVINHYRVQAAMHGFAAICNSSSDDRLYLHSRCFTPPAGWSPSASR